jgi:hypothetical protein
MVISVITIFDMVSVEESKNMIEKLADAPIYSTILSPLTEYSDLVITYISNRTPTTQNR